jgi:integrase
LEGFQKWLKEKNLQGKSIKNVMGILHGFLTHFKSTLNLFPTFPAINYQQKRIKWFTEKELDEVFEFINEQDRGYFLFIRYYGVRPEEASGLLRSAVNWETRQIIISSVYVDGKIKARTKTNRERVLPIIPEVGLMTEMVGEGTEAQGKDLIPERPMHSRAYPLRRPAQPDSIFVFSVNGHPYTRHIRENRWNRAMKQAIKKYATRPMTLRDLRSSAGSRWRKAGMPIEDISQLLGHSKIEMTKERYADQAQDNLVPIMRGINERK